MEYEGGKSGPTGVGTIGVIGAGTIGASWAALFLAQGLRVRCFDPASRGDVQDIIAGAWRGLARLQPLPDLSEAFGRFTLHDSVQAAVTGCDFVQESLPEQLQLKQEVLAAVETGLTPDALIASSTSGIPPTTMQRDMAHPERFLVGHPFNPPHLMPLVEVVGGQATSSVAITRAMDFYASIGKRPIHIRKEVPGHVANRLQAALWREAVHLAAEGVASVADIDTAVVAGPGMRWAVMGPHMTLHLAGGRGGMTHFLDHLGPAFASWWDDLGQPTLDRHVCEVLTEAFAADTMAPERLALERDDRLIDLLRAAKPLS